MLPDLRVSESSAADSLFFTHQTFGENSCELEEMCVSGSGRRRLLQFEGRIENWGPGDLNPGPEHDNPLFEYSACHEHYHFRDFTDYRLLNADGSVAAQGHKQSFCLLNMAQVEGAVTPGPHGVHPPPGETGCNLSVGRLGGYLRRRHAVSVGRHHRRRARRLRARAGGQSARARA